MAIRGYYGVVLGATLSVAFFPAAGEESRPVVIYNKENAPPTPKVEELEQRESVTQYGITWTFDKKVPMGRFVTGDWYVVGPVTVTQIAPGWDGTKNGSMLNVPPAGFQSGFDSRMRHKSWFKPNLTTKTPISMKPGDALASSIGLAQVKDYCIDTFAVLTCLKEPVPPDAFRPGYTDREQVIYRARDLKREWLPMLPKIKDTPDIKKSANTFARPWLEHGFFEADQASYQRGGYGRGTCQVGAHVSLLLCLDFKPEEKEPLLIGFVQFGIELWGLVRSGHRGWVAHGGWGSGRKWPIVFSGLMLGDDKMAHVHQHYPDTAFQEDTQTMYDDCWTGAGVVYSGHIGHVRAQKEKVETGWGPYEHLPPSRWLRFIGQSYRCNMTSSTWVGQALAVRLLNAEKEWGYDAWLDYCDRWMYEPDPGYGTWPACGFGKQGNTYEAFFKDMWLAYREKLPAIPGRECPPRPTTGWIKERALKSVAVDVGKGRGFTVSGRPFFPIMVFAEHPKKIADVRAISANVVAEGTFETNDNGRSQMIWKEWLTNRKFLDDLAAQGLYGVFGADARTIGHPALLGWIHVDEPDRLLNAPSEEQKGSEVVIPSYGLTVLSMRKDDPEPKEKQKELTVVGTAYRWMKKMDASRPAFLTVGPAFFKALADGKKELCEEYLKYSDAVGCRMAGEGTGEAVAKLRELAPGKPVFAWIETKGATPDAVRAAVRTAIAKGASGIGYRGFEGFGDEKPEAGVMSELKRINETITAHAAELLADPAQAEVLLK